MSFPENSGTLDKSDVQLDGAFRGGIDCLSGKVEMRELFCDNDRTVASFCSCTAVNLRIRTPRALSISSFLLPDTTWLLSFKYSRKCGNSQSLNIVTSTLSLLVASITISDVVNGSGADVKEYQLLSEITEVSKWGIEQPHPEYFLYIKIGELYNESQNVTIAKNVFNTFNQRLTVCFQQHNNAFFFHPLRNVPCMDI